MRTVNRALMEVEVGTLRGVSGIEVAAAVGRRRGALRARSTPATRRETVDADAASRRTTRAMVVATTPSCNRLHSVAIGLLPVSPVTMETITIRRK